MIWKESIVVTDMYYCHHVFFCLKAFSLVYFACVFLCLQRDGLYLQPSILHGAGVWSTCICMCKSLREHTSSLLSAMMTCFSMWWCVVFPRYCLALCSWTLYARVYRYKPKMCITCVICTRCVCAFVSCTLKKCKHRNKAWLMLYVLNSTQVELSSVIVSIQSLIYFYFKTVRESFPSYGFSIRECLGVEEKVHYVTSFCMKITCTCMCKRAKCVLFLWNHP